MFFSVFSWLDIDLCPWTEHHKSAHVLTRLSHLNAQYVHLFLLRNAYFDHLAKILFFLLCCKIHIFLLENNKQSLGRQLSSCKYNDLHQTPLPPPPSRFSICWWFWPETLLTLTVAKQWLSTLGTPPHLSIGTLLQGWAPSFTTKKKYWLLIWVHVCLFSSAGHNLQLILVFMLKLFYFWPVGTSLW